MAHDPVYNRTIPDDYADELSTGMRGGSFYVPLEFRPLEAQATHAWHYAYQSYAFAKELEENDTDKDDFWYLVKIKDWHERARIAPKLDRLPEDKKEVIALYVASLATETRGAA